MHRPLCPEPGRPAARAAAADRGSAHAAQWSTLSWNEAFDSRHMIDLPAASSHAAVSMHGALPAAAAPKSSARLDSFCVYAASPASACAAAAHPAGEPPPFLALLLHGGGQSSLAWACVAVSADATCSAAATAVRVIVLTAPLSPRLLPAVCSLT